MSNEFKLKNCPFCNNEISFLGSNPIGNRQARFSCSTCGYELFFHYFYGSDLKSAKKWNSLQVTKLKYDAVEQGLEVLTSSNDKKALAKKALDGLKKDYAAMEARLIDERQANLKLNALLQKGIDRIAKCEIVKGGFKQNEPND